MAFSYTATDRQDMICIEIFSTYLDMFVLISGFHLFHFSRNVSFNLSLPFLQKTPGTFCHPSRSPPPPPSPQYARRVGRRPPMDPVHLAYAASKLSAWLDSCEAPTGSVWGHTELFWHCTLVLLKRSAVTRWMTPCTCTTHS